MWRDFPVQTRHQTEFVSITRLVEEAVKDSGISQGFCSVFVPHTTAGVTINENADPDVVSDLEGALARIVPSGPYRHAEGNSPAHIRASLMGSSVTLPVLRGQLAFGTWQGVFFCEFDGPRRRRVMVGCWGE